MESYFHSIPFSSYHNHPAKTNTNKVRIASHAARRSTSLFPTTHTPQQLLGMYSICHPHSTKREEKKTRQGKRDFYIIIHYSGHEVEGHSCSLAIPYFIFVVLRLIPKERLA